MSRLCLLLLLWLSLSGESSPTMPDVVDAGRTAATLSDWQTIAFFLMFIIVVSTVERLIAGWQSRSTATKLAQAIDRLADATESRATDIKVTLALMQATEKDLRDNQTVIQTTLSRLETILVALMGERT